MGFGLGSVSLTSLGTGVVTDQGTRAPAGVGGGGEEEVLALGSWSHKGLSVG